MLPEEVLNEEEYNIEEDTTSYDFKADYEAKRIDGTCSGIDEIKQVILHILSTERYEYPIYDWDYGIELKDLIGEPINYVMSELPYRIEDALLEDNRIDSVENFEITKNGKNIFCKFVVNTIFGNSEIEKEFDGIV